MSFSDILRALIEERGITQKQLAQDLCIAASTIGGYVQGTSEPDFNTLKILAEYFAVSSDYMLNIHTGKDKNQNESEVLRIYRSLTPEQQEIYLEQGKAMIKLNNKKKEPSLKSTS